MARGRKSTAELATERDHGVMRPRQHAVQETLRIEYRQRRGREHVLHDFERGLGGARTVGMAAHAVEYQQHCGVVGDDDRTAVLVVLPVTERGDLRVFDLHGVSFGLPAF